MFLIWSVKEQLSYFYSPYSHLLLYRLLSIMHLTGPIRCMGFHPFALLLKDNEAVAFSACCISWVSHLLASFRDFLNSHTTPSPILISLLLWFYFFLFLFQWDIPGNWREILISPPPFIYWSPLLAS